MLRVEEITDARCLADYQSQWQSLVEQSPCGSIFNTYEWTAAWLDCFGRGKPISFFLFWRGNQLRGLAPLVVDYDGRTGCRNCLTSLNNEHTKRTGLICAEGPCEVIQSLVLHLNKTRRHYRVVLPNILETDPIVGAAAKIASSHRAQTMTMPGTASPITRFDGDWNVYLGSRSNHVIRECRRKVNRMDRAGRVERRVVSAPEECDGAMDDILSIERHSWKEGVRTSFSSDGNVSRFYRMFARSAAANGWLRSYLLYLNSEPIAHILGLTFKGEYLALKTSYDLRHRGLSPGAVLFDFALRDAFDCGATLFDFLGTDSRWKEELSNGARGHVRLCLFSADEYACQLHRVVESRLRPFFRANLPMVVDAKRWLSRRFGRS
jgi:CelD/BcsL family acetyltransferase involved in cellulose biosynthesis